MNLCGILDHFGYKAPDFSYIHESIWYDLGRFEDWLIDRRGLNLGDVVPFRSRRLPGPTCPDSEDTSSSAGEEPFVSASSTTSKAVSLPEHLNGSEWDSSSSKAIANSDLAISSTEKPAEAESFVAPLTKEMIEKADILLETNEDNPSVSIHGWLGKTTSASPSITEIQHPLSSSPTEPVSQGITIDELSMQKIKEEPNFSASAQPAQLSSSFTAVVVENKQPILAKHKDTPSPMKGPLLIAPVVPKVAPRKSKAKVRGLSFLRSALEVPSEVKLLAGGRKPTATSTPQNLSVRYNPRSCRLGGLPVGSTEMKEFKSPSNVSQKKGKSSE